MPRKSAPDSELVQLLTLLRRIIVLSVAAYGLALGMPYLVLGLRLAVLWAVLYIASGVVDVVFRRLHHAALQRHSAAPAAENSKLPQPSAARTE